MNTPVTARMSGRVYSVAGDRNHILVTGEESGGAFTMIETFAPPMHGPPPHIHHREDEYFHVLEGEFTFTVGERVTRATAGQTLFGKRGVPHSFKNTGDKPGRLMIIVTPSGIENFFAEIGTPLPSPHSPPVDASPGDIRRIVEAAPRYGLEIIP